MLEAPSPIVIEYRPGRTAATPSRSTVQNAHAPSMFVELTATSTDSPAFTCSFAIAKSDFLGGMNAEPACQYTCRWQQAGVFERKRNGNKILTKGIGLS